MNLIHRAGISPIAKRPSRINAHGVYGVGTRFMRLNHHTLPFPFWTLQRGKETKQGE